MSRALTSETSVDPQMADDHLGLVDAYERSDVAAARRIIVDHNAPAKQNQRADLAALSVRSPQPGSSQPGSSQPGSSQPGSSQPGSSQTRET